jgi:hypothetical protein
VSVRDRFEKKPTTQEEVDQYVAGDKDLKPFAGAGSMDNRWAIGQKTNQPNTVRGKMGHADRAKFVADLSLPCGLVTGKSLMY